MKKWNCRKLIGNEKSRYLPMLDTLILDYLAIVLIVDMLFLISPVLSLVAKTPLYSIRTYLGLFGGVLLVVDLFTNKGLWRGTYVLLLYVICALSIIASIRTIGYGIKDNIYSITWFIIACSLMYTAAYRCDNDYIYRRGKWLYAIAVTIWFVACVVSVGQYVLQVGYRCIIDVNSADGSASRQGVMDNRLFGVFTTLNHAVFVSLIMLLINTHIFLKSDCLPIRIAVLSANLVFLLHVMLSLSRSGILSLFCAIFLCAWLLLRRIDNPNCIKQKVYSFIGAIIVLAISVMGYTLIYNLMQNVPVWVEASINGLEEFELSESHSISLQGGVTNSGDRINEIKMPTVEGKPMVYGLASFRINDEEANITKTESAQEDKKITTDIMGRTYSDGDISNDRFKIWRDYVSLYKEVGLIGLSPGNYMPYIQEKYPDLYIVTYIQKAYPEKYDAGVIYHVHSGYLTVYVAAGLIGVIALLAFMLLCIYRTLRHISQNRKLDQRYIFQLAVVLVMSISALLDKEIFFMDNVPSFAFWIALGAVMKKNMIENYADKQGHGST